MSDIGSPFIDSILRMNRVNSPPEYEAAKRIRPLKYPLFPLLLRPIRRLSSGMGKEASATISSFSMDMYILPRTSLKSGSRAMSVFRSSAESENVAALPSLSALTNSV